MRRREKFCAHLKERKTRAYHATGSKRKLVFKSGIVKVVESVALTQRDDIHRKENSFIAAIRAVISGYESEIRE